MSIKHFIICLYVILLYQPCLAVDTEPIGWATLGGGTTGGQGGEVVTVTNKADFVSAVSDSTPRIVQVVGTIHGDYIIPNVGSNKTILGIGYDARIVGFTVKVTEVDNVIIRNIAFHGAIPQDGLTCRRATHIWVDHCTFFDAADGLLDITDQCDYVTVSWCRFYNTSKVNPHRFACLVGSTDNNPTDAGKLNVTFHHNWWGSNVDQRMPRGRYGKNHVFNNYYSCTGNSYCVGGSWGFNVLLENNYFDHVNNPMNDAGHVDVGTEGTYTVEIKSVGNIFDGCMGNKSTYGDAFVPAYTYLLDPAANIPSIVKGGAGATILAGDPALWPTKATVPTPVNGDYNAAAASILTWRAGSTAVSHNVYFGTTPTGLVNYGNQTATSFAPPALIADTKYYWRIDEVASDDSVITGDLWTFKTVPVLSANLYHYWPFDVDFLDVAKVFASNPNNPFGAAWLDTNAKLLGSGCLDFTYQKDGLIVGWSDSSTNKIFPNAAPMTISLWFKPTALPASDKTACMLGNKVGELTSAKTFRIELLPSGACRLTVDTATPEFGNLPALNGWNHVLISINASGQLQAWLNANEAGSITLATSASNNYNGQYAGIGFYGDEPSVNAMSRGDYAGYIDDVAIWNVWSDLTLAQILYDDGIGRTAIGDPVFTTDSISNLDGIELTPYTGQSLTDFADGIGVFSKESGPQWLHVLPNGTLSGIPNNANIGQNIFTVRYENTSGDYDTATMTIQVANVYSGTQGMDDLLGLAAQWLMPDCGACNGADLDGDHDVTLRDLGILAHNWLADETLQLYWTLDETGGDIAKDESIYDRSGQLVNNPTWSSEGMAGGALILDGIDDYITVPCTPALNGVDFTVAFWVRVDGNTDIYRAAVCSRDVTDGFYSGYNLFAGPSNTWDFWTGTGSSWNILTGPAVADGQWTHIGLTFQATSGPDAGGVYTGTKVLYINGVPTVSSTTARYVPNTLEPFTLGRINHSQLWYFNGPFDEVRVYDAALSEQEIQSLWQ